VTGDLDALDERPAEEALEVRSSGDASRRCSTVLGAYRARADHLRTEGSRRSQVSRSRCRRTIGRTSRATAL
jgi:hypothetical protein